jgi:hypothetical protein
VHWASTYVSVPWREWITNSSNGGLIIEGATVKVSQLIKQWSQLRA